MGDKSDRIYVTVGVLFKTCVNVSVPVNLSIGKSERNKLLAKSLGKLQLLLVLGQLSELSSDIVGYAPYSKNLSYAFIDSVLP